MLPSNTLPQSITENVHRFLTNYIEDNAFVLPGRIPGFKREDVQVLSSSETKTSVWRVYTTTCTASGEQAVSYSKFVDLWHQFCPRVVVAKPMTDLCLTCQQNTTKLVRAANLPEHEKANCIKAQQEHLDCVQVEREFYRKTCSDAATTFSHTDADTNFNETHEPCSFSGTMHYSFDYAQQVHFPSNPMQPGPIYFKVPREYLTSPEQACVLLKDGAVIPPVSVLPQKINPEGLSDERRNYLHREIRQFCKPGTEDLVAPVP